ncbi:hypothetical protein D3C73_984930 [compost metagenome]
MERIASAMFCTAMVTKPSASSPGVTGRPVAASTSAAMASNFARTASASSGWSAFGPKTAGKKSALSLPIMTLQSVTVSGPPRR